MFSKEKNIITYSVEKCTQCNLEIKRKFKDGDFVFSEISKCTSCGGLSVIDKIFGESIAR